MRTDSCDNGFEQIAKRVATAKTQDDLFALLGQVAQYFDHEEGITHNKTYSLRGPESAEGLASSILPPGIATPPVVLSCRAATNSLHNAILLRDGSQRKYYRTSLGHSRALQCTVLVTAVEMMLRCSADALVDNMDLFREDLVPCMPKLLNLFISWEGGETEMIRCFAISNSIKIVRRIGVVCQEATGTFIESLLMVLRGYIAGAPEIHVEAASAIAHIFDHQDRTARRKRVIEQVNGDSSLIISTLSTAALAANADDADEILIGLFNFAVNSQNFRTKMVKRRCTILAIGKHLSSNQVENRKLALNICKCLLNDNNMQATVEPVRLDGNQELLIGKIIDSALNEQEIMLQIYAISLLGDAVRNANLQPSMRFTIMDRLKHLVDSDGHDDVVMEASVTYAKAATAIHPEEIPKDVLANVADFTTLPFARTRTTAIASIDLFVSHDNLTSFLLLETEMLENFSLILSYGSTSDGVDAINICRRLAQNTHRSTLCQSSSFLHSLVKVVTQEDVIDRTCYAGAIETLLPLLSKHTQCFLPFPDLLPVLVSLANTVSDEELKQRLVKAIVSLSSALLG